MGVSNYFEREVKRRSFVVARWDFREREKMEIEQEKKAKAGVRLLHDSRQQYLKF
jgi:hypothetical protein